MNILKPMVWVAMAMMLLSCQDDYLNRKDGDLANRSQSLHRGMQRAKFGSREDLERVLEHLSDKTSRSSDASVQYSENEEKFVSLVEANKQKVLSQLTPEQLKEIENDPDGLEFEPSDSVIADIRYAQLLNANREIQVGDTVYKFASLGVSFRDMGISIPNNTEVELYCGKVYGAIKYDNKWLAATIEKPIPKTK